MKTIDELQAEIAGLKAILQDKDKEIETLEKVKKEKDKEIETLEKVKKEKSEQIAKRNLANQAKKLLMDNFLFLMSSMRLKHLESQFKVSRHRKVLYLSIKEEKLKREVSLMTFLLR